MINHKRREMFKRRKAAVLRFKQKTIAKEPIVSNEFNVRDHTLYHLIEADVVELWRHARRHMKEGLTVAGVWCLIEDAVSKLVKVLHRVEADGQDKKELVILLVEQLYEEEIKPIDLPWVPNSVEGFLDDTIGRAIRPTVSWLIDKVCD